MKIYATLDEAKLISRLVKKEITVLEGELEKHPGLDKAGSVREAVEENIAMLKKISLYVDLTLK